MSWRFSQKWAAGAGRGRKKVAAILGKSDLTINEVTAETLDHKIDSFERLDRMPGSAEARRNNALREIDRHREAIGGVLRQSIEEIEGADFRDVETRQVTKDAGPRLARVSGAPIAPTRDRAWAQDCGGKGPLGAKCRSFARPGGRGDGAQNLWTLCGCRNAGVGPADTGLTLAVLFAP
jgi:hypothetical protein